MQPDVSSALAEAANLLLVGMVVVFLFLTMLIGAINLIAWINRQFPEAPATNSHQPVKNVPNVGANKPGVSPKIVAAIGAAIRQHRQ